jgi:hypothetical protein
MSFVFPGVSISNTIQGVGVTSRRAVRAATTVDGTLATAYDNLSVVDGVTLATGDRILIKNQTLATENGVYNVIAAGAPVLAGDFKTGASVGGSVYYVNEGTANENLEFRCTNNPPADIVGTHTAVFAEVIGSCIRDTTNGQTEVCANDADITMQVDNVIRATVKNNGAFQVGLGTALGINSFCGGTGGLVLGDLSHAIGSGCIVFGVGSHAEGQGSTVFGDYSHTEGSATCNGNKSHSEGTSTCNGDLAHSEGSASTANGDNAHAEGFGTNAGSNSTHIAAHAEGQFTWSYGIATHTEGYASIGGGILAIGNGAHAGGYSATNGSVIEAVGNGSMARGYTNVSSARITASTLGSFAGGYADTGIISTVNNGALAYGHCIGAGSAITATGLGSIAMGYSSSALTSLSAAGIGSIALGSGAKTTTNNSYCWSDGTDVTNATAQRYLIRAGGQVEIANGATTSAITSTVNNHVTWSYTPTTPGNWSAAPTSVSQALDLVIVSGAGVILDDTAADFPTAPQTEGVWYGDNTKANGVATSVRLGNAAEALGVGTIAIGNTARTGTSAATGCISIGDTSGNDMKTGVNNVLMGDNTGDALTSGADNTSIGYQAGSAITTGGNHTFVGSGATTVGANAATITGTTIIGQGATANFTDSVVIGRGITDVTQAGLYIRHRGPIAATVNPAGWLAGVNELVEVTSSIRYKQNVRDLEPVSDKIDQLRPVRYNPKEGHGDPNEEHLGFIAEEVELLYPETVTKDAEGLTSGMMYDRIVPVLLKELQSMRKRMAEMEAKLTTMP